ncbi:MAG TPA: glutathione S-transferase N-terminal domain-containing protein [Solirubrobacteraceae bacterium]|jgi:glutathione S-transferase|nr:glutathione S-transferase N-terminal domain-containing protein [Solirubrobacteraceae bacterium]
MPAGECKLYVLPNSHPCAAVEAALRLKGQSFERVDLLPMSQVLVGAIRFGGFTVPGMRIDGERLVGSRPIMRRLDGLVPEPPLLPADPDLRRRVLDVERWGDEILQGVPRRILDVSFLRDPSAMEVFADGYDLPLPRAVLRPALPLTARVLATRWRATDERALADIRALPGRLQRIDEWIAEGVLGGDQPNAADLQIGSSIRLLGAIEDLRPMIEQHAAAALTRFFPPMTAAIPAGTLPAGWLEAAPVSGAAAATG